MDEATPPTTPGSVILDLDTGETLTLAADGRWEHPDTCVTNMWPGSRTTTVRLHPTHIRRFQVISTPKRG